MFCFMCIGGFGLGRLQDSVFGAHPKQKKFISKIVKTYFSIKDDLNCPLTEAQHSNTLLKPIF